MRITCKCGNGFNADHIEQREDRDEDIDLVYFSRNTRNGVFNVVGVRKAGIETCGVCLEKAKQARREEKMKEKMKQKEKEES